jgi:hypothetical protein
MKKYFMKHATSRRGFRNGANAQAPFAIETSALISNGYVNANVLMEGDEIFTVPADVLIGGIAVAKAGDVWLNVTLLNEVEVVDGWVAQRHMGVDVMVLGENIPVEYPDFVYDASTESEWPIEVFHNDVSIGVFEGTIRVVSKNPTLKLT